MSVKILRRPGRLNIEGLSKGKTSKNRSSCLNLTLPLGSAGVYLPCSVYDGAAFLFLRAFGKAGGDGRGQSGDPSAPGRGDSGASSAPARGDITKEALTGSRDAAKQTAGPRRAWEKRHYGPTVN